MLTSEFNIEDALKDQAKILTQLDQVEKSFTFEGRSETPEERASRLRQEEWKTKVKLGKDIAVSVAALIYGGRNRYFYLPEYYPLEPQRQRR